MAWSEWEQLKSTAAAAERERGASGTGADSWSGPALPGAGGLGPGLVGDGGGTGAGLSGGAGGPTGGGGSGPGLTPGGVPGPGLIGSGAAGAGLGVGGPGVGAGGPAGGDAGGGLLVVRDSELGALGSLAFGLRERLRRDADHARARTCTAATGLFNGGLDLGAALTELSEAWNTQSRTLVDACGHISNHLDFTQAQHAKDDVKVATAVSASRITEYYR